MSQDSDKAWEIHSQIPGGGREQRQWSPWASLCLCPQFFPKPYPTSPSPPPRPVPNETSPIREEAVYNAFSQGVHGQRPNLLQIHAAVGSKFKEG